MTFSIVLPCFNEEHNIANTVLDCQAWMRREGINGEIVVVNDGSRDGSQRVLEELQADVPQLTVVRHERNRGYGAAVRSGFDAAKGDLVGFMDSDGQFKAQDFSRLLPHLERYAFVSGYRVKRADPFIRKVNSKMYNLLVRYVLRARVRDVNCAMKAFRRSIWNDIRPVVATGALVNGEIYFGLSQLGIPWKEVPVPHYPRTAGSPTGAKLSVILRMFKELWILRTSGRYAKRKQRAA